jgi:hypothetical protein
VKFAKEVQAMMKDGTLLVHKDNNFQGYTSHSFTNHETPS